MQLSSTSSPLHRRRAVAAGARGRRPRPPIRAKVGLQIETAGSAAILGQLLVTAIALPHRNPLEARTQGDIRESPLAPGLSQLLKLPIENASRGFARHPGANTMLQGSSCGEEGIKKPHICRIGFKTPVAPKA